MNQNAEQIARDEIDRQLLACGWLVQHRKHANLSAGPGVAIRQIVASLNGKNKSMDKQPR